MAQALTAIIGHGKLELLRRGSTEESRSVSQALPKRSSRANSHPGPSLAEATDGPRDSDTDLDCSEGESARFRAAHTDEIPDTPRQRLEVLGEQAVVCLEGR